MKKTTANWLASAEYDLKAAEAMLKSRRYLYVVFMGHLAIEKTLKALHSEMRPDDPPRTHDLLLLVRRLGLVMPKSHLRFLGFMTNMSIPTRYPEDLRQMVKRYPRRTAVSHLNRTRRVLEWLRCQPPLVTT